MNNSQSSDRVKSLTKLFDLVTQGTPTALDDGSTQARQILANEIRAELYARGGTNQVSGALRDALHSLCVDLTPTDGVLTTVMTTTVKLNAAEIAYDLGKIIEKCSVEDPSEARAQLQAMRAASAAFYQAAVHTGVHAFIEFTGLMNEFINVCEQTAREGKDFTQANAHCGQTLNMQTYQAQYLAEKLECIFGSTFNAHLDLTMAFLTQFLNKEMRQEVAGALAAKSVASTTAVVS